MSTRASSRGDVVHLARDARSGIEAVTASFHGQAYDMHRHESDWLVGVTHAGVQDFFCRGGRQQSTSGRVILIEPGERHDGKAGHPEGFSYSMLYLPHAWLRDEIGGREDDWGFRRTLADDARLGESIKAACVALLHGSPLAFDAQRDQVIRLLQRHLGRAPMQQPSTDAGVARRAMDYLQAHYGDAFGLDELARAAGAASRFQLSRSFRSLYGTSPHACLIEIRLDKARALLRASAAPAEVAAASGFADQSHLGRWFRRAYGVTPSAYRRGRTNVPDTA